MAHSSKDDFLFGPDLDAVLSLIESDCFHESPEVSSMFSETLSDVSRDKVEVFSCSQCPKVYKTSRRLKRHIMNKHKEEDNFDYEEALPKNQLKDFIDMSKEKLVSDQCFSKFLEDFKSMSVSNEIVGDVFETIKYVVRDYKIKGDSEIFYPAFYKCIHESPKLFGMENKNCNKLLGFELANHVLGYISGATIKKDVIFFKHSSEDLNEKEKSIVYYLSGYVFSTIYKRLRYSKKKLLAKKNEDSSFYLDILFAGKVTDTNSADEPEQKLVNARNRGGLWKVTKEVFDIFCITECYFRKYVSKCVTKIDSMEMVTSLSKDASIKSNFSKLLNSTAVSDLKEELKDNFLEDILHLYIKVRTFSMVKSKQQSHKMLTKKQKSRSLRTSIKQSVNREDQDGENPVV